MFCMVAPSLGLALRIVRLACVTLLLRLERRTRILVIRLVLRPLMLEEVLVPLLQVSSLLLLRLLPL
jgi:hypothetical protein